MAITFGRNFWCLCSSLLLVIAASPAHAETKLFESVQVTPSGEYTFGIEGPAADLDGNLFVVNFGKPGTIGKLPAGGAASEQFTALPEGSVGNAIRFARDGTMFIADYKKHNIFAIPKGASRARRLVSFRRDEPAQRHHHRRATARSTRAIRTGRAGKATSGASPNPPTARCRGR